jgi:DinB superfamily
MVSEDVRSRVSSYIKHNATKPIPEVIERVREQLDELNTLVAGMSAEQESFRPYPDEWSSREVAGHIAMYSPSVRQLVLDLDAGRPGTYYRESGVPPERPVGDVEIKDALAVAYRELGSLAEAFAERDPNSAATFPHPWFGELNAREWIFLLRVHAGDHLGQIRKNVEHPDYPRL